MDFYLDIKFQTFFLISKNLPNGSKLKFDLRNTICLTLT